jgi:transposase
MWTPEHRRAANRNGLRYPSDLTDDEWAIVRPMIPARVAHRRLARLEIVKRSDAGGFEVLPKRWIVEWTFTWASRNRRLARDFER